MWDNSLINMISDSKYMRYNNMGKKIRLLPLLHPLKQGRLGEVEHVPYDKRFRLVPPLTPTTPVPSYSRRGVGNQMQKSYKIKKMPYNFRTGISIIEMVVYVGLLGIISVFIINSLIQVISTYQHARVQREVLSNARLIMETLTKQIAYSQEVYAPSSRFNSNTGQISLITPFDTLPQHTTTYLDIWTDGNRLLMREEGRATTTLSSATVQITQFRASRIFQGLGREALQITLGVSSSALPLIASTTLQTTTTLRGSY